MQPPIEDAPTMPQASSRFRARLAARLPEILIEALFTLVAVLLAFAIEEWREERELDRIAGEARHAIVQEIEHNHEELLESRESTVNMIARLESMLDATTPAEPTALRDVSVRFELALLSGAAWRSAQSMDVSRRMDYGWMLPVARAYELQGMYEQAQWDAVEANTQLRSAHDDIARVIAARAVLVRLRELDGFSRSLEDDYTDVLNEQAAKAAL